MSGQSPFTDTINKNHLNESKNHGADKNNYILYDFVLPHSCVIKLQRQRTRLMAARILETMTGC